MTWFQYLTKRYKGWGHPVRLSLIEQHIDAMVVLQEDISPATDPEYIYHFDALAELTLSANDPAGFLT